MREIKDDYSLDPHPCGTLYKKIKDHGKEFRVTDSVKNHLKYMLYESNNSLAPQWYY